MPTPTETAAIQSAYNQALIQRRPEIYFQELGLYTSTPQYFSTYVLRMYDFIVSAPTFVSIIEDNYAANKIENDFGGDFSASARNELLMQLMEADHDAREVVVDGLITDFEDLSYEEIYQYHQVAYGSAFPAHANAEEAWVYFHLGVPGILGPTDWQTVDTIGEFFSNLVVFWTLVNQEAGITAYENAYEWAQDMAPLWVWNREIDEWVRGDDVFLESFFEASPSGQIQFNNLLLPIADRVELAPAKDGFYGTGFAAALMSVLTEEGVAGLESVATNQNGAIVLDVAGVNATYSAETDWLESIGSGAKFSLVGDATEQNWSVIEDASGSFEILIESIDELNPAVVVLTLGEQEFFAGSDDTMILGGSWNEKLHGGSGDDAIFAGAGVDTVVGGGGDNLLVGGAIDDEELDVADYSSAGSPITVKYEEDEEAASPLLVADGSGGVDTLVSIEKVVGTSGNDTLLVNSSIPQGLRLTVDGGGGADTVNASALSGLVIVLDGNGNGTVTDQSTGGSIELFNFESSNIVSGIGADVIRAADGNDTIHGDSGSDKLDGGGGNDVLYGDSGFDVIEGGAGNDVLDSGLSGFSGVPWIWTEIPQGQPKGPFEVLDGGEGNDVLVAGHTHVMMIGGPGDDIYDARAIPDDTYNGAFIQFGADDGHDVILGDGAPSNLFFSDYTGIDAIQFVGLNHDDVELHYNYSIWHMYAYESADDWLAEMTGTLTVVVKSTGASIQIGEWVDVTGGEGYSPAIFEDQGRVYLFADGSFFILSEIAEDGGWIATPNLTPTTGADSLIGGSGSDNMSGGDGDDLVSGAGGSDDLSGGSGNDVLDGGTGADTITGGIGNDTYVVDDLGDLISESGGDGTDTVMTSLPDYTLSSDFENLTLTGTSGISATGNVVANQLTGNSGANTLSGGDGADTLAGNVGADTLVGGTGDDTYVVDSVDVVTENAGGGTDTVQSSATYSLAFLAEVENLTLTGSANNRDATGNTLDNVLTGNSGTNKLDGGAGADTLLGGAGNDIYVVDASDVVSEDSVVGIDRVESAGTYTLGANVENLTLTLNASVDGTGNALDNELIGNSGTNTLTGLEGNDKLDGGAGADTLVGGLGNDTYAVDSSDVVTEGLGEGTDTIQTSSTYTLASLSNVENLTLTGSGNIDATGNALDNVLTGNFGLNTLTGGLGNDTYVVDSSSDVVTEASGEGTDTVQSSVAYTLASLSNVENLTLTGSAVSATGNGVANVLTGNSGANTLDGGAGADTLFGGLGDDTYVVDASDVVSENVGEGTDTVQSSITYTLGSNLENLTLTGSDSINGTGNALDNVLTGNSGVNTLAGGLGNDTYVVDSSDVITENPGEGTDTVQSSVAYTLASLSNVENLTLTGSGNIDATGNTLDNVLTGNSGANTLTGGAGNDVYVVGASDAVIENPGEGTDTIQSADTYTLGSNVENLTLTGTSAINATGNTLDNALTGNTGNNTLTSLEGNDTLDGGAGADTLVGGLGNDTYIVDASDLVTEALGEGTDTVQTSITYTLGSNLENLTLTGSSGLNATGNTLANVLTGNTGNNTLDGNTGIDTLVGGHGDDTYIVDSTDDVVTEAVGAGTDTVQSSSTYTLASNIENLTLTGSSAINGTGNILDNTLTGNLGANVLAGGAGNDTYIIDAADTLTEASNEGTDTVQSSASYTLGSNIENLTLTGSSAINGTGNSLDNVLTGNSGANTLDGSAGADTMSGGSGDDVYVVDNSSDLVTEWFGGGTDTVQSSVSYFLGSYVENLTLTGSSAIDAIGNSLANVLTGNSGANKLDGGSGADTMTGGSGDDVYIVDNASDTVTEASGEGTDTVQSSMTYTLGANVENLTLTGTASINGNGNSLDNVLTGNSGANVLTGGAGNDTYVVDNAGDSVVEAAAEGTDTVQSAITYSLSSNVENLTLTGTSSINGTGNSVGNLLTGNSGANTLSGGSGNDTINGGIGADTLVGGLDDDTYVVDTGGDIITEALGEGTDTAQSSVSHTLAANVENLTLTGSSAINATGNTLGNVLTGNAGNNILDGDTGDDTLFGGLGDDTYVVGSAGDVVTEASAEGTDTVQSSITYTLGSNLENLTLTGVSAIDGTGNTLDNTLTGNSGTNALTGSDGNDTLSGGAGADTMVGGTGNDTLVVDDAGDVVTETSAEGTDTVQSSITYALGSNIENLTLTGFAAINATGNSVDNSLTGNSSANTLSGGDGNDTLDGGWGADTLIGGTGNDTYVVDNTSDSVTESSGEGTDTVQSSTSYTLGSNVENLTLIGSLDVNATGNTLDNALTGNLGANTLDGGAGADTMAGGLGNDTYVVDNAGDVVTEATGEGTDTVQSSITYTLGSNLENLTLTGSSNINATGNSLDNVLTGNSGANALTGGDGNDILNAGTGADTMVGGVGNDTFVIDDAGDVVTESSGEGTDSVQSSITYTLGSNLENLTLTGSSGISGTGNALDNALTGNSGANTLTGGSGNDTLDGNTGADTLIGGLGDDIYIVDDPADVVTESSGEGNDTVLSFIGAVAFANVEHVVLVGSAAVNATGNSLNNTLIGNTGANTLTGSDGNDTLNGGVGADTLIGGTGDDVYVVDNGNDSVTESSGEGTDTVQSSISYTLGSNVELVVLTGSSDINATGNTLNNVLTGNSGANTLDGGTGADTMTGGIGNDTYVVDNPSDVVTELSSEGTDTVQSSITYTLGSNVENLTLTGSSSIDGTGNALDNTLIGNSGANVLTGGDGNDTLNAGAGADTMVGGVGNDTFVVDDPGDVVIEALGEGTDTVQSSITYTLGSNLENLSLTGTSSINATGNTLDNALTGNSGENTLDGGAGADTMAGGTGNDTYVVDNAGDTVGEATAEGTDTVQSSIAYILGANLENVTLVGSSAINATGNALDNVLTGNSGVNTLTGGAGNDIYVVQNSDDVVVEVSDEGTDTVQSSVSYILAAGIENLTLTGSSDINGTGNGLDNVLTGNSGTNVLSGGAGNDTYVVQNAGDVVIEAPGQGTDTVQSATAYTLGANLENLTLTGASAIDGTGNIFENLLTGNSGANALSGSGGHDTLIGGEGADTMSGGAQDDTYVVDNAGDSVIELVNEGTDTVQSSISYTLGANVENLTLTGSASISGTGNSLDNKLTGNVGANALTGGTGNDTYVIDNVGDTVTELSGEGTDTVLSSLTYTLGANVENLTLTGSENRNATGNGLYNVLIGNIGSNVLDGGAGIDLMKGGLGNDTYIVDDAGDTVVELVSQGTDTVESSITFTLGANVENLTLTGSSGINGTGNTLDNELTGNSGNNTLTGGDGNDTLKGGAGADTLFGGLGNDTYVVGAAGDVVTEASGEGTDTVQSAITYTLGSNVENLTLTGSSAINATGNALSNTLTGNTGNNTLDGGTGSDTLVGGLGDDIFVVNVAGDVVVEASAEGTDTVQSSVTYTLASNIEDLTLTGSSNLSGTGNALANVLTGNTGANTLTGADGNDSLVGLGGADTLLGDLGDDTLAGGGGTDSLYGADGNDSLAGGGGADTMAGGAGEDIYEVDNVGDVVTETGTDGFLDAVISSITYTLGPNIERLLLVVSETSGISATGNSLDNVISGNNGNNTLTGAGGNDSIYGALGADTLIGGIGDDFYWVDGSDDVVTENSGEGIDVINVSGTGLASLSYTLGSNIENLTMYISGTGTGNALDNVLAAGAGSDNNFVGGDGNDTLNGGGFGNDTLVGGTGDDTYVIGNVGVSVTEASGEGTDTVQSSITYTLGSNFENLTLTGSSVINGTGNSLANVLTGNTADNTLDGAAGADTIIGGLGNDTLVVDDAGDVVTEGSGEGTDTVQSAITYTLGSNLENLTLTGSSGINGTGNSLDNVLTGNTGTNTLNGGDGNDALNGGAGADTLIGGIGNDTFIVDDAGDVVTEALGEGTDTVQSSVTYTLSSNVENLTLTGSSAINGTGNTLGNVLIGNAGGNMLTGGDGNDLLDGAAGADTMVGGLGNDIFIVDDAGDVVSEASSEGADTVQSSITYALGSNVENLTLTGSSGISGTGNSLDNVLIGNSGANTLTGSDGNDTLNGGTGADTLVGGIGNDTFVVSDAGDVVSEASGEGTDMVQSSISYTLGSNVENLTLSGFSAINGIGNSLDNLLIGNFGTNTLSGGDGNDTLAGGSGADTMTGGAGTDTFVYVSTSDGGDTITDFNNGNDTIDLSAIDAIPGGDDSAFIYGGTTATNHGIWYTESAGNTIVHVDTDANTATDEMIVTLLGTGLGLSAADFIV